MNLSKYERETILNFNEGDSEASIYTHNRPLMRRLEKLSKDRPGECRLSKTTHDGQAAEFYIPRTGQGSVKDAKVHFNVRHNMSGRGPTYDDRGVIPMF